jgi:hypothetical protein
VQEINTEPASPFKSSKLPISLTSVTRVSKFLAAILFILLPLIGFYFGMVYQRELDAPFMDIEKLPDTNNRVVPSNVQIEAELPESVNNSALYYIRDKKLYRQTPLFSDPQIYIDLVDSYAFSHDNKLIAYIKQYGDGDNSVYVQSVETGDVLLNIPEGNWKVNRGIKWSPDSTYLLINAGTGPEGSNTVYNANTGEFVSAFSDGNFVWVDNENIYTTRRTDVDPYRPWGAGNGYSLAKVNIVTKETEIIATADANNDYQVLKYENQCLYYEKETVNDPDDWSDAEKISTSQYCYDLNTRISRVATEDVETSTNLKDKVKLLFPDFNSRENEILQVFEHPDFQEWFIVQVYHGDSVYDSDIAILNSNDPLDTYQILAKGTGISWR